MTGPKVFLSRRIYQAAMDKIQETAELEVWPAETAPPYEILVEKVSQADGILIMREDKIDAALLEKTARLRVVSTMAVGYDNIDIGAATRLRIRVGYTPGVLSETTADLAFSLLMAAARRIVESDRYVREGRWQYWSPNLMLGQDIHKATLGIIGLGRIGLEMAKRARGFEMKVLYYNRTRKTAEEEKKWGVEYASLKDLLACADFVSLHVPLNKETRHLIGTKELGIMKPSAILINTARGSVVDQSALYLALKKQQIRAAALDVFESEPVTVDDPLLKLDNLVITPHIGSASSATRSQMALIAAENLLAGLRGENPPHCVNPF
jgi:glyoxylate reductase